MDSKQSSDNQRVGQRAKTYSVAAPAPGDGITVTVSSAPWIVIVRLELNPRCLTGVLAGRSGCAWIASVSKSGVVGASPVNVSGSVDSLSGSGEWEWATTWSGLDCEFDRTITESGAVIDGSWVTYNEQVSRDGYRNKFLSELGFYTNLASA